MGFFLVGIFSIAFSWFHFNIANNNNNTHSAHGIVNKCGFQYPKIHQQSHFYYKCILLHALRWDTNVRLIQWLSAFRYNCRNDYGLRDEENWMNERECSNDMTDSISKKWFSVYLCSFFISVWKVFIFQFWYFTLVPVYLMVSIDWHILWHIWLSSLFS